MYGGAAPQFVGGLHPRKPQAGGRLPTLGSPPVSMAAPVSPSQWTLEEGTTTPAARRHRRYMSFRTLVRALRRSACSAPVLVALVVVVCWWFNAAHRTAALNDAFAQVERAMLRKDAVCMTSLDAGVAGQLVAFAPPASLRMISPTITTTFGTSVSAWEVRIQHYFLILCARACGTTQCDYSSACISPCRSPISVRP